MKRTLTLFACVAVYCAMTVSCKNAKTAEPTPEEIQAQKQALADSVLAEMDSLYAEYINAYEEGFQIANFELTESEKLVKPDYLLEPSKVNEFVTKSQKVNALAFYFVECAVRKIYDMPLEETKEAIMKLLAEYNYPIDNLKDKPLPSDKIKTLYEECRKRGDLAYFWQFQSAIMSEVSYILANNPELFYSKINNEQWDAFCDRFVAMESAIERLAKYDEEMSKLWEFRSKHNPYVSSERRKMVNQSVDSVKQHHINYKDKYIARRNALLQ